MQHAVMARFAIVIPLALAVPPMKAAVPNGVTVRLLPKVTGVEVDFPPHRPATKAVALHIEVANAGVDSVAFEAFEFLGLRAGFTGGVPMRIQIMQEGTWSPKPIMGFGIFDVRSVQKLRTDASVPQYTFSTYAIPRGAKVRFEVLLESLPDNWESVRLRFHPPPRIQSRSARHAVCERSALPVHRRYHTRRRETLRQRDYTGGRRVRYVRDIRVPDLGDEAYEHSPESSLILRRSNVFVHINASPAKLKQSMAKTIVAALESSLR